MTDKFLQNIQSISRNSVPEAVFEHAAVCLIDTLGCIVAGQKLFSEKVSAYDDSFVSETGNCSVIGIQKKDTAQTAALLNGISAHALELDDGHRIGMVHLGAPIIPALLAVAEKENLSGRDLLYGIVIGYEVAIRLACAIQPGCKLRGYHATGICGTVGGAMAIAAALNFDEEQRKAAFSAAVSSSAGLLEMIEGDTELKPYNAGRAAMDAVAAAYIGKARFKAPEDALGGKRGFLAAFTDEPKMKYIEEFVPGIYYIDTIYNKPYAACRHCHPAIEAAMIIRQQDGFDLSAVESVDIETYALAVKGHDHTVIKGINSAKMSIPYSFAVSLVTGKGGMNEYTETYVSDNTVLEIASKVHVADREDLTAACPQQRIAEVTLHADNRTFSARVEYPKGEPENPVSQKDIEDKFIGLAAFAGVSVENAKDVIADIERFDFSISSILNKLS